MKKEIHPAIFAGVVVVVLIVGFFIYRRASAPPVVPQSVVDEHRNMEEFYRNQGRVRPGNSR